MSFRDLRRMAIALVVVPELAPAQHLDLAPRQIVGTLGQGLDSTLRSFESKGFSGSVLVVSGDRVVLLEGYRATNRETGARNVPDTRYEGYREPMFSKRETPAGPHNWGRRGADGVVATVGDLYR
jgi:hypothetical protein